MIKEKAEAVNRRFKAFFESFDSIMPLCAVLAACYIVGAALGCSIPNSLDKQNILLKISDFSDISFFPIILNELKYMALAFFLGMSFAGVAVIPLTVAVKGFCTAFTVASIYKLAGFTGIAAAAALCGIAGPVSIAGLLTVSAAGMKASAAIISSLAAGNDKSKKKIPLNYLPINLTAFAAASVFASLQIVFADRIFSVFDILQPR